MKHNSVALLTARNMNSPDVDRILYETPSLKLANSMEQSRSWEGNSHSASKEIPRLLPNL
jgi:hypothetical protein